MNMGWHVISASTSVLPVKMALPYKHSALTAHNPFASCNLQFCAIVNINLAVVNTLPLPALDGGYLVLLMLEAIRGGKKLPEKFEQVGT